jgi:hypothetical protein
MSSDSYVTPSVIKPHVIHKLRDNLALHQRTAKNSALPLKSSGKKAELLRKLRELLREADAIMFFRDSSD